jgi:hypothetical protein
VGDGLFEQEITDVSRFFADARLAGTSVVRMAALGAVLILLPLFIVVPGTLGATWIVGFVAIGCAFAYRWGTYSAYEPLLPRLIAVLRVAGLWSAGMLALYLAILIIRVVIESIAYVASALSGIVS